MDSLCPWCDVMRMEPYFCGPKIHNLSLTMRKKSDKSKLRDITQNPWQLLPKTGQLIKNNESQEQLRSQVGQGQGN